ncbi:hypothetical protein HZC34_02365 [Candidatus Saganbacteria bacterium]|nr:hypothetical protein [Candidatus Saganbacteria bacterium]
MVYVNAFRNLVSVAGRVPHVYRGKQVMWGLGHLVSKVRDKIYVDNPSQSPVAILDFLSIRPKDEIIIPKTISGVMYEANVDSLSIKVNDAPILHYGYIERPSHAFTTALKIAFRELASNGIPSKPIKMDFSYYFETDLHGSGPCGRVIAKAELRSDGNKHAVLEFYYEIQYA